MMMGPAEFRTLTTAMGMGRDWIAAQLRVNPKSVHRWQTDVDPPGDVAAWAREWWTRYLDRVETILDQAEAALSEEHDSPQVVRLERYRHDGACHRAGHAPMTAQMHGALVGMISAACELAGARVEITWAPGEET